MFLSFFQYKVIPMSSTGVPPPPISVNPSAVVPGALAGHSADPAVLSARAERGVNRGGGRVAEEHDTGYGQC